MEAMIIGDIMERRQDQSTSTSYAPIVFASTAPVGAGPVVFATSSPTLQTTATTQAPVVVTTTAVSTPAATASSTSAPESSSTLPTTTLIAILVPVCVLLAAIPTVAYLCYLRRRDRRNREMEAEIMRGRLANSGSSSHTAEAHLMRRSMSGSSQREPKYPSVSTEDLDLATMEKGRTGPIIRDSASIFAPQSHGPGRRPAPGKVDTSAKPGVPVPPVASQSPTLPPLDFGKDGVEKDPFAMSTSTSSPPKSSVPSSLPTFAVTQPKRAPNPALAPAPATANSRNAPSPSPLGASMSPAIPSSKASPQLSATENPNWPLPAPSVRDSASTYSSVGTAPAPGANKPLPSGLSRELSPGRGAAVPRNPSTRSAQPGPRESSIAYGMPPIPPSPETEQVGPGDRRSGASRKRDSDAVSELSYSASMRGKRDTRRDTDAISVISAMSDRDR